MTRTLTVAFAVAALSLTSACGGAERPTEKQIEKALTAGDAVIPVPEQFASCFAKVLVDSKLSNETLQAIVKQDKDYEGTKAEEKELTKIGQDAATKCAEGS